MPRQPRREVQPTLEELKRRAESVFAAAQATIADAYRIASAANKSVIPIQRINPDLRAWELIARRWMNYAVDRPRTSA